MSANRGGITMGGFRKGLLALASAGSVLMGAEATSSGAGDTPAAFQQYCYNCHGKAKVAGLNLQELAGHGKIGDHFQHWERVVEALQQHRMPPPKMKQPTEAEREQAVTWVRAKLREAALTNSGEPGRVTVRRLTSGEYTYTVQDLTGLDLKFDHDFVGDQVGGEGFTNYGDVQFMADGELQRYLEAAKQIAGHAIIGAGPLQFSEYTGKSGLELSAVARIQQVYTKHGFRAVGGEGARPYGLDNYGQAFYAAWRYRHRKALGEPQATLEQIAVQQGGSPRFARYIWSLVNDPKLTYPLTDIAAKWKALPSPQSAADAAAGRKAVQDLQQFVVEWPRLLYAAGPLESTVGDDPVYLLTPETLALKPAAPVRYIARVKVQGSVRLYLTATNVNPEAKEQAYVVWRNLKVRPRQRMAGKDLSGFKPLREALGAAAAKLNFGKAPDGTPLGDPEALAVPAGSLVELELPVPVGMPALELAGEVAIEPGKVGNAVVRATVTESQEPGKGRTTPVLLADPASAGYKQWKAEVLRFAAALPQKSHGEPTPSDRDPIPPPFNTAYNQPERDRFHTKIKYYRDDRYLYDHMLDDAARTKLDQAWADLLSAFDFHDENLRFIADKYKLTLKQKTVAELDPATIAALPEEPRKYVQALRANYDQVQGMLRAARPGQVEDAVKFAGKAWRRPLTPAEQESLRGFYAKLRSGPELDHATAVRSLLTRVLVAPAFLYRLEQPAAPGAKLAANKNSDRQLSSWELANRLSFFLWSSGPDDELRRAAAAGELNTPQGLQKQTKRMLADAKARRLATEFFGQWLGFYRFDQYKGVDSTKFPEFSEDVKSAMYDEAVAFFEHIVRKDRPVREMFNADYTFLNKALAKHYGVKQDVKATDEPELVTGANAFHRGGMLRLGAVLTATSAPLRTSPVKRGDWVLRRILGTPTPPPPPNAGSIPADEKAFGGQTLFERLESHKRNPSCASCHTRIDPLGFPLESYDAVGRWRDSYADGKPVHNQSVTIDKTEIKGVDGMLAYLQKNEPQVLRTFSFKLLGYALGRTVLVTDLPLVEKLTTAGGDATFAQLAAEIVGSRQFRYRREGDDSLPEPTKAPEHPQQSAQLKAVPKGKEGEE